MARKHKNLASFGDLARIENNNINDKVNKDINVNDKVNKDINVNDKVNKDTNVNDKVNKDIDVNDNNKNDNQKDFLDNLIEGTKKRQPQRILTGVYLDPNIVKVLDQLAQKGGRGAKSRIVNEALEKVFKEKGLL
jgi:hypothetical protein